MSKTTARNFEIFLEKKFRDEKPCFWHEKQPNFTALEPAREHNCNVGDICCSKLALSMCRHMGMLRYNRRGQARIYLFRVQPARFSTPEAF